MGRSVVFPLFDKLLSFENHNRAGKTRRRDPGIEEKTGAEETEAGEAGTEETGDQGRIREIASNLGAGISIGADVPWFAGYRGRLSVKRRS
jgi:hypothetical protein